MTNNEIDSIIAMNEHMAKLTEQRDELLSALQMVCDNPSSFSFEVVRAAIAKATNA